MKVNKETDEVTGEWLRQIGADLLMCSRESYELRPAGWEARLVVVPKCGPLDGLLEIGKTLIRRNPTREHVTKLMACDLPD